ncbi:ATP-dependent DNA helicase [Candidatus Woesearchaeota archaeon]|nr:ATP-dependent DNA helicase [Candidatus Woesearchaeota archaeon]
MAKTAGTLFPYDKIRPVQDRFIDDVNSALDGHSDLIVHAPTGLGKTAGVFSPALGHALKNRKKIIFLTSRHTQHDLAVQTLRDIKRAHGTKITVADIIGKKWMCPQEGTDKLYSGEFAEFCRSMKESGNCEFYNNTKKNGKLSVDAEKVLSDCKSIINNVGEVVGRCSEHRLCAYEISLEAASKADVVIADYYYVFNPQISKHFLARTEIKLEDCIIIVDEAHNLPARIMELATSKISTQVLLRAEKEALKHGYSDSVQMIGQVEEALRKISGSMREGEERIVRKEELVDWIGGKEDFLEIKDELEEASDEVRKAQRQSYLGSVSQFMDLWLLPSEGFSRIISVERYRNSRAITLFNHCLDPSVISREVIRGSYATILMSGTLTPTQMYNDLLGFDNAIQRCYESPFPEMNRLNMIIPKTTTKFTKRDEMQFMNIAAECAGITDVVPGNSILFFPSYFIRDMVNVFFSKSSKKTVFYESADMSKDEKADLLERFKSYRKTGAVLLAVASGSFAEGIDLPGDLLKCVVVVGLPLLQPDLRTKELISYYDQKFGKGWDYGYLFPAFNKVLQSAGRCIRSETDRGAIAFLDERYLWPNYRRCFPPDMKLEVVKDYRDRLIDFF